MTAPGDSAAPALIWCPFPDRDSAEQIAATLLDEGLIACANILAEMISLYVWNGEQGRERETPALLKTNSAMLEQTIARLSRLHPYEEPAILGWCCDDAAPGTAEWLRKLGR